MTGRLHVVFGVLSACTVMLAIGLGFSLVGSPTTRRAERFDEERLRDLQVIVREVHNLVVEPGPPPTLRGPLPKTLDEIAEKARLEKIVTHDPETGEAYRYVVKDGTTFELCAASRMPASPPTACTGITPPASTATRSKCSTHHRSTDGNSIARGVK